MKHCVCPCSAKGFQHHRMTNGAMNVEIGNPAYKIYEGDPDDDAGELLDSDFALDPDKVSLLQTTTKKTIKFAAFGAYFNYQNDHNIHFDCSDIICI